MVETNVHFPADTSQLYDAMRKVLEVCATLSALQGSTQWRQFSHNLRGIKRLLRVVHKLKRSTSKKPEKKAQKNQKIKQAHREYLAAANYQCRYLLLKSSDCTVVTTISARRQSSRFSL